MMVRLDLHVAFAAKTVVLAHQMPVRELEFLVSYIAYRKFPSPEIQIRVAPVHHPIRCDRHNGVSTQNPSPLPLTHSRILIQKCPVHPPVPPPQKLLLSQLDPVLLGTFLHTPELPLRIPRMIQIVHSYADNLLQLRHPPDQPLVVVLPLVIAHPYRRIRRRPAVPVQCTELRKMLRLQRWRKSRKNVHLVANTLQNLPDTPVKKWLAPLQRNRHTLRQIQPVEPLYPLPTAHLLQSRSPVRGPVMPRDAVWTRQVAGIRQIYADVIIVDGNPDSPCLSCVSSVCCQLLSGLRPRRCTPQVPAPTASPWATSRCMVASLHRRTFPAQATLPRNSNCHAELT